jgi:chemotaxis protein methyltransferase CheR
MAASVVTRPEADGRQPIEELEIDLLLEGVFQRFGHDFRGYRRGPLAQKLRQLMQGLGLQTILSLLDRVMHDESVAEALLRTIGTRPAGMFEDPEYYSALREAIGPWLRSSPSPKVWIAECASVEEVGSLAIVLAEEELYSKTRIFATVANEATLQEARRGGFAPERMAEYEENYRRSGGRKSLADYCVEDGGRMYFAPGVLKHVTWAQYNLATDASFNEFELILCRRALADFGPALRRRVLQLFHESMPLFGLLGIDEKSGCDDTRFMTNFRALNMRYGLFRRIA